MSVFDNFADTPNQIKIEGQEITIKFNRTSETTARISWNIPTPVNGCPSDRQAYDGIVITVSGKPANYLSTSPKDGTYYEADPTADYDIHSGSVLDGAYVIGAFYHDKLTTFLDIDGIQPKTPYYVSGYAVDAVGRYHREGVHAYSLPTGVQEYTTEDYPAKHEIMIYSVNPVLSKSPTGLQEDQTYTLPVRMECKNYDITVDGVNARTYGDLVSAINQAFMKVTNPHSSPLPPHAGSYYKDNGNFFLFNGTTLTPVNVVSSTHDLTTPVLGTYWLNPVTGLLQQYGLGGWSSITNIIESNEEPTDVSAYDVWFDGTTVRVWENTHWRDYVTYIQDRNPQLPPLLQLGDYWYNTTDKEFFKWNEVLKTWDDSLVIYYDIDPNSLPAGTYWYDENNEVIKRLAGVNWVTESGVIYADSTSTGAFPSNLEAPVAGTKWFDTRTMTFYIRDLMNINWDETDFVSLPVNPKKRELCDLWWNSSPSVDDLFVWEPLSGSWTPVPNFYRQETDPNTPPTLDPYTAWIDLQGELTLITPSDCRQINYIESTLNPNEIADGAIWKDSNGNYYVYQSSQWILLDSIIKYASDPYNVVNGMLWYDLTSLNLYKYESGSWVEKCLLIEDDFLPAKGDQWYNTVDEILLEWNGVTWLPTSPFIKVEFVQRTCQDEYEKLVFSTKKVGCNEAFEILSNGNSLFENLMNSVIYTDPLDGYDGMDAGPMYLQMGVGDDGSPDERRKLHEDIRMTFGHPSVRVELTKQQLDQCIDNALLMMRKHSTYSYKKGMFFMDLKRNQQIYKMTNRCVGYNKIVNILSLHRTKAGAFRTAYSQNDNFAFAALQQLYTLGTFDMLTFHLTSAYVKELEILFASRIMFQWLERKRELKIYQMPRAKERVLVEAIIERTEQELFTDRETAYWIKRWAIVEAKGMLAQIRGKFATLPGPNGTTQLNANDLATQMETERTLLVEELQSKAMQDMTDIGLAAHLVIG